jgi:hypothetical protein
MHPHPGQYIKNVQDGLPDPQLTWRETYSYSNHQKIAGSRKNIANYR